MLMNVCYTNEINIIIDLFVLYVVHYFMLSYQLVIRERGEGREREGEREREKERARERERDFITHICYSKTHHFMSL